MHRYPAALTHLDTIRLCLGRVPDETTRLDGLELVERLEIYIRFKKLTKPMMLHALDGFRDVPGAADSIQALEAMAAPGRSPP